MQISASIVKELREKTGAGMMDCKNALIEAGSIEGAIKLLREKGLAKAQKKGSRIAAEGLIQIHLSHGASAMVEVNCETDFVARNEDFKKLVSDIAKVAISYKGCGSNIEGAELLEYEMPSGASVSSEISKRVASIGEKIELRRFARLEGGTLYGEYLHGAGSIGVLVELACTSNNLENTEIKQAARDLAMHIAASNPSFIKLTDIPENFKASEREIFKNQVLAEGKPVNMVEKIVDGKLAKHLKDMCLLDQPFIKNPDITIAAMLDEVKKKTGATLQVQKMVRFKVGEGIEKQADNFIEEVKKMAC